MESELRDTVDKLTQEREASRRSSQERQAQLQQSEQQRQLVVAELQAARTRNENVESELRGLSERLERQAEQFSQLKHVYDEVVVSDRRARATPSRSSQTSHHL